MRKFGATLLIVLAALAGLAAVLLLGVNLYVQSEGTHTRIQQELSQRIGATLRLQRTSVTPWGGLKLSGITIPQVDSPDGAEFLRAKTFRLRVDFWSLFSQRLIIKEVSLVDPHVVWAQNRSGEWRLPMAPQIDASPSPGAPLRDHDTSKVPPPIPPSPGTDTAVGIPSTIPNDALGDTEPEEELAGAAFTPEVRRVNLTGGNFQFLDRRKQVVARFEGIEFHSSFRTATALRGTATIGKTSLRDRFLLEDLKASLRYDPSALEFSQISATAAGGILNGRFRLQPQSAESPFTANVTFRDVEADRLVAQAGGPAGVMSGKLEGHLEAAGKTADPDALRGSGEIFLRDGEVKQYSLLTAVGQLLQIEELTRLHLDQAHVKYHIEPGVVLVDELVLRSPNIRVTAKGTVTFAGKVRLQSQLAVNEKIRGQLFRGIRENFHPVEEQGYAGVDFQVSGTVDKPKNNLMDKLVGREIKDLGSVISSIFGSGKSERQPKPGAAAPSAEPAASPSLESSAPPEATPLSTAAAASPAPNQ